MIVFITNDCRFCGRAMRRDGQLWWCPDVVHCAATLDANSGCPQCGGVNSGDCHVCRGRAA